MGGYRTILLGYGFQNSLKNLKQAGRFALPFNGTQRYTPVSSMPSVFWFPDLFLFHASIRLKVLFIRKHI